MLLQGVHGEDVLFDWLPCDQVPPDAEVQHCRPHQLSSNPALQAATKSGRCYCENVVVESIVRALRAEPPPLSQRQRTLMGRLEPRYSKEEFRRRGQTIYERDIRSQLKADDEGKFVAIDIETGEYEMDRDDYAATERLLGRRPDAQIWLLRVGHRATYRLGGRPGHEQAWLPVW